MSINSLHVVCASLVIGWANCLKKDPAKADLDYTCCTLYFHYWCIENVSSGFWSNAGLHGIATENLQTSLIGG